MAALAFSSIVGIGLIASYLSRYANADPHKLSTTTITGGEVRDMFPDQHSLYPKNSQPFRLDPFIPKFPQVQGNPSREDRMQNQFPDVNFQQSRTIDKTHSNWQNYAGANSNETLFDIRKNIALHEDKYNKDDWCWANGYFMSPLYLQHVGTTVSAPQKINRVFL